VPTTNSRGGNAQRSASSTAEATALAEAAEAEADAAEARAVAARARARALELRRQADAATTEVPEDTETPESTDPRDDREPPESGDTPEEATAAAATESATEDVDAADTDGQSDDDADDSVGGLPVKQRRWRRRGQPRRNRAVVGAALAVVIICALLGASGYMAWKHRAVAQERHRSAEFAAAARQGVVSLTSMDFHTAQQDVQRVLDNSTGPFKDDFQTRAGDFTKTVEQSKVVTKGTVNAAAVESMTDNSAVVLVAATSEVTNSAGAKQEPRAWRLSVSVSDDAGQIKMSKVEFVP
jgi:Mce-associated membrane protein